MLYHLGKLIHGLPSLDHASDRVDAIATVLDYL